MAKKKGRKRQQKKLQQQSGLDDKAAAAEALADDAEGDEEDDDDEGEPAPAPVAIPVDAAPPSSIAAPGAQVVDSAPQAPSPAWTPPGAAVLSPPATAGTPVTLAAAPVEIHAASPSAFAKKDALEADGLDKLGGQGAPPPGDPASPGASWPARLSDFLTEQFEFSSLYAWVLISVVVFAAYANSLWVPFLFDDAPVITRNRNFRKLSFENFVDVLKQPPQTRALTNLTFYANYQIAGTPAYQIADPSSPYRGTYGPTWTYHVFNMALHSFNGILLFTLLLALLTATPRSQARATAARRAATLGRGPPASDSMDSMAAIAPWVALGGTLLWLVHPVQTMAVTYISQRYAMCGAAAFLSTLVCYVTLRRRIQDGTAWLTEHRTSSIALLLGTFGCYLTCFLTKENAAMAPFVIVALELAFFSKPAASSSDALSPTVQRWAIPAALVGLFCFAAVVGMAKFGVQFLLPDHCPTFPDRESYFRTELVVLLKYLRLYAFPDELSMEQAFPGLAWTAEQASSLHLQAEPWEILKAIVGHLLIVGLALKWWLSGRRFLAFVVAWYYITLGPESSFVPILDPMVEHRMYLPSCLLAGGVAYVFAQTAIGLYEMTPGWTKTAVPAFLGVLRSSDGGEGTGSGVPIALVALGGLTAVLAACLLITPIVIVCLAAAVGVVAFATRGGKEGEESLARWLSTRHQALGAWTLAVWAAVIAALGFGAFLRNRVYTPTGIWQDAIAKRPDCARAYSSLGMEFLYQEDWFNAIEPIEAALYLGPYHVEGWNNIGKAYLEIGTALPNGPKNLAACPPLEWARDALMRGIDVNEVAPSPSVPLCWNNLGLTYLKMAERLGKDDGSEKEKEHLEKLAANALEEACSIDKGYETAWINLGTCLVKQADRASGAERKAYARKAIGAFASSHATDPNHQLFPLCGRNLAQAYRLCGLHVIAYRVREILETREDSAMAEISLALMVDEAAAAAEEALGLDARIESLRALPDDKAAQEDLSELATEQRLLSRLLPEFDKTAQRAEARAAEFVKNEPTFAAKLYRGAARVFLARGNAELGRKDLDLSLQYASSAQKALWEREAREDRLRASTGPQGPVGPVGPH